MQSLLPAHPSHTETRVMKLMNIARIDLLPQALLAALLNVKTRLIPILTPLTPSPLQQI
jgi:hypothetical protein